MMLVYLFTQFEPMVDQTIIHYATDGWLLHKGAEDAKRQMETDRMEQEAASKVEHEVGCLALSPIGACEFECCSCWHWRCRRGTCGDAILCIWPEHI
jgi:hypothetical protein